MFGKKLEPLFSDLQGEFNREIDDKNHLVYHMDDKKIYIEHCSDHCKNK